VAMCSSLLLPRELCLTVLTGISKKWHTYNHK
jgi:hypothetical protein